MSERTQVEVLLPLNRAPQDRHEEKHLLRIAFDEAKRLIHPGRVLGMVGVVSAVHQDTGAPALKVRFAVEAPESIQPQRNVLATR